MKRGTRVAARATAGGAAPRAPQQAEQLRERLGGGSTPRYVHGRWVHCPRSSPGGIRSPSRSALRVLLLEAARERDRRPVRPNLRTSPEPGRKPQPARFFGGPWPLTPSNGGEVPQPPIARRWPGFGAGCRENVRGLWFAGRVMRSGVPRPWPEPGFREGAARLPGGECWAAGRRLRAHPSRRAGPGGPSRRDPAAPVTAPPTATMSHRGGPDRHDVTSLRSRECRQAGRNGTPEPQVTPVAHDASPACSLRRSHTHAASTS